MAPGRAKLAERLERKGSSRTQYTHMSISIEKVPNFCFVSHIQGDYLADSGTIDIFSLRAHPCASS